MATEEYTLAEMFKAQGYETAMYGKWHLGNMPELLPPAQGFDEYVGIPYSNDMWPRVLLEGNEVIKKDPDQRFFTKMFTEKTLDFAKRNKEKPFFVYLTHPMPHLPIHVSPEGKGKSYGSDYGDVVEELDRYMGVLLKGLKDLKIDENTLVVFTSDNGPWLPYKEKAGTAGPLRGGKNDTFEGGSRVPFIAYWPGKIKAHSSTELLTAMDLMPTFAHLIGFDLDKLPNKIDGIDSWNVIADGEKSVRDSFLYYTFGGQLDAIRNAEWKYFIHKNELYNLRKDIGEKWNVADKNQSVCKRLKELALKLDSELTENQRARGYVPLKPELKAGDIEIKASNAKVTGQGGLRLETPNGNLAYWSSDKNLATWGKQLEAGKYEVLLFSASGNKTPSTFTLSVGDQKISNKATYTKSWGKYQTTSVGKINLSKTAKTKITLQMTDNKGPLFNLLSIVLRPIN